tara:strand:+ start:140 stop:2119 length:1980 start_codon:yes stop_codon:yes gene_type:complete
MKGEYKATGSSIGNILTIKNNELTDKNDVPALFTLPKFQREYTWTTKNIEEFYEDLRSTSDDSLNFIGTVILYKDPNNKRFNIIDGQQRITTSIILASVIKFILKNNINSDEFSNEQKTQFNYLQLLNDVQYSFLSNKDPLIDTQTNNLTYKNKWDLIYLPDENIEDEFIEYIVDMPKLTADMTLKSKFGKVSNLFKNHKSNFITFYNLIKEDLDKEESAKSKLNYLNNLFKKLSDTKIILTQINDLETAYEMFETVNARGIELSQSDLLKTYVLLKSQSSKNLTEKKCLSIWEEIKNNVEASSLSGSKSLTTFFRYYFIGKYKFLTAKNLYKGFKENINNNNIEEFLTDSKKFSKIMSDLNSTDENTWKNLISDRRHRQQLMQSLDLLNNVFGTKQQLTLLGVLFSKHKEGHISSRTLVRITKLLELFIFKFSVVFSGRANKVENLYAKFARHINEICDSKDTKNISKNMDRTINNLFKSLESLMPTKKEFIEKLKLFRYAEGKSQNNRRINYILNALYTDQFDSDETKIDFGISLEHIYPRDSKTTYGDMKNYDSLDQFKNRLGNLTILGGKLNGEASNKSISKKVNIYKKSRFDMTNNLLLKELQEHPKFLKSDEFDFESFKEYIKDRTNRINEKVYKRLIKKIKKIRKDFKPKEE